MKSSFSCLWLLVVFLKNPMLFLFPIVCKWSISILSGNCQVLCYISGVLKFHDYVSYCGLLPFFWAFRGHDYVSYCGLLSFFWAFWACFLVWESLLFYFYFLWIPPFVSLFGTPITQILNFLDCWFVFFFNLLYPFSLFSLFHFIVWDFSSIIFSFLLNFAFQQLFLFSKNHFCVLPFPLYCLPSSLLSLLLLVF